MILMFNDRIVFEDPGDADADLAKWRTVKNHLDSPSLPFVQPAQWLSIASMNSAINHQIHYVSDLSDHWQTPDETSALGTGDCEDFAIFKLAALKKAGFDYNNICLMLGEIASMALSPTGHTAHCFLIIELDGQQRVLDSMSDRLILPNEYINWQPMKAIVADKLFLIQKPTTIADVMKQPHV